MFPYVSRGYSKIIKRKGQGGKNIGNKDKRKSRGRLPVVYQRENKGGQARGGGFNLSMPCLRELLPRRYENLADNTVKTAHKEQDVIAPHFENLI